MKSNIKKFSFIAGILAIIMIAFFTAFSTESIVVSTVSVLEAGNFVRESNEADKPDDKIYCNATIDDDFVPGSVIVVLDKQISDYNGLSEKFYSRLFRGIEYTNIEDLTDYGDAVKNNNKLKNHFEQIDFRQILSVEIPGSSKQQVLDTIKLLEKIDGVVSAEPNYTYSLESTICSEETVNEQTNIPTSSSAPDDSDFGKLWGLTDTYGINAKTAWTVTTGSRNIRVGVIDTGISKHEDLVDNLADGWDFYNNNSVTDDDEDGHGTHVAGTIGAVGDNGIGVTGVAQNVTLVPLQACHWDINKQDYLFSMSDVSDAIEYATRFWGTSKQISVLNFSVGGFGISTSILTKISQFPGLFVWSAGNDDVDVDTYSTINNFDLDNLISVGSVQSNGDKSSFSNYGEAVDIYAPGTNIYSTIPDDDYGNKSGTSMAAPHVSGSAALLASYDPSLTGAELKELLLDGADDISIEGENAKLLNIGNMLWALGNPDRLELKNKGRFIKGGGCTGTSPGWTIEVTNNSNSSITVVYNMMMCLEGDAKAWTGLKHIDYFDLPAGASKTVDVEENGFATTVAFSYVSSSNRYITYANELNSSRNRIIPDKSDVKVQSYTQNGMTVSIVGKNGNKWLVDLTNNTGKNRTFYYNSRMCYAGDAQNWLNLSDVKSIYLANGATTPEPLEITENMTATSIAISYTEGIQRFIFYAYDLNVSGTMSAFENTKPQIYDAYGMSVAITGKEGNTWKIYLRNDTGMRRTFEYNRKMCFAGDAETWNLSADVGTVTLEPGGNCTLSISENGTATSIAISYIDNNYRKIFYAYDLKKNEATMTKEQASFDVNSPPDTCIAAGTLITLADGTQKAVEELTGDEMLLVWNMETGTFDSAPIIFIDSDQIGHYEVIALEFSDGTTVDVISEHAFWDLDLNKYVYLDENAEEYIGDWFNKQTVNDDGSYGWTEVQLTDVEISTEVTEAYSPVTYGHLCYYVNGMLSMPGGITGFINIFDVDPETLTIDEEAKAADIEEYGLFTYEEFYEIFPVSEDVFEAFNGQYLKISVGKGLITYEQIGALIERYSEFF